MSQRKGRELTFKWNDTKVGHIMSVSMNVDGNVIDVSNDDSGDWNEYLAGRKDWTMSLTCHTDEHDSSSEQATITTDFVDSNSSGTVSFGPETPQTDDVTYSGEVFITNFTIDRGDSDGAIESSWEFQGSGALTRSVTAA